MKDKFKEHHIIDHTEKIFKDAIIVLDTNSILNLYRYSEENRTKYFEILKKVESRLYLTHHICDEFYKNRLIIIENRSTFKETINELIEEYQNKLLNTIKNCTGSDKYNSSLSILKHETALKDSIIDELEKSTKRLSNIINDFKQDLDIKYVQNEDPILESIVDIIKEKVSSEISFDDKERIYKEGEERYKLEVPPGYKDNSKESIDKYGDLVIWNELQTLSKESERDILFISDDRKEDWAIKFKGYDLGPRKELIKEFLKNTNNLFYSITTKRFIQLISESYKITDTKTLEEETENIQRSILQKEKLQHIEKLKNIQRDMLQKEKFKYTQIPQDGYENMNDFLKQINAPVEFDESKSQELFERKYFSADDPDLRFRILKELNNSTEKYNKTNELLKQLRSSISNNDLNINYEPNYPIDDYYIKRFNEYKKKKDKDKDDLGKD